MTIDNFLDGHINGVTLTNKHQTEVYRVGNTLYEVGEAGTSIDPEMITSIDYGKVPYADPG